MNVFYMIFWAVIAVVFLVTIVSLVAGLYRLLGDILEELRRRK